MSGWISVHRKMTENWIWEDKPFSYGQAWIDILLECNHKSNKTLIKGKLLEAGRGESVKSLKTWALRWGWTISKVRHFVNLLEKDGMLRTNNEHVTTRLTVCNYDTYQDKQHAESTQKDFTKHAQGTHKATNNNDNKVISNTLSIRADEKFRKFPAKNEVQEYFIQEKSTKDAADVFYSHYEVKEWYSIASDGVRYFDISPNRKWKLKADEWIKKDRIKKIEREQRNGNNRNGNKQNGATDEELAEIATRRYIRQQQEQ